jgi:hypothetical protein
MAVPSCDVSPANATINVNSLDEAFRKDWKLIAI